MRLKHRSDPAQLSALISIKYLGSGAIDSHTMLSYTLIANTSPFIEKLLSVAFDVTKQDRQLSASELYSVT
jgi:hypothetical protein